MGLRNTVFLLLRQDLCRNRSRYTPTIHYHSDNPLTVWHGNRLIGIDCGSGFPINENAYLDKGRLACLRLDDMKEFYSDSNAEDSLR